MITEFKAEVWVPLCALEFRENPEKAKNELLDAHVAATHAEALKAGLRPTNVRMGEWSFNELQERWQVTYTLEAER